MFCRQCGFENKDDSNFCKKCGSKLVKISEEPVTQENGKKNIAIIIGAVIALLVVLIIGGVLIYKLVSANNSSKALPAEIETEAEDEDEDDEINVSDEEENTGNDTEKEKESQTVEVKEDDNNQNSDGKYRQSISIAYDDIKSEEAAIREQVNSNSLNYTYHEYRTEDLVWKREYWSDGDNLIFAYFSEASDGSLDQRFYFKDRKLIEWIPYTGNGAPEDVRKYASDATLDTEWYDCQEMVLRDFEDGNNQNANYEFDAVFDTNYINFVLNNLEGYEFEICSELYWITPEKRELYIDYDKSDEDRAQIIILSYDLEANAVLYEEFEETLIYALSQDDFDRRSEWLFEMDTPTAVLPLYNPEHIGICRYEDYPAVTISLLENETDYSVRDYQTMYASNTEYKIVKEIFCGYWGDNNGESNFELEYTLSLSDGEAVLDSLKIKRID